MDMQRLLRIRKPESDESLAGFLIRLAEANFMKSPDWITGIAKCGFSLFRSRFGHLREGASETALLAKLTGLTTAELFALSYPLANGTEEKQSKRALIHGRIVPTHVIRIHVPKVCAACLRFSNYYRKIWDLDAVTCCPIHKCLLLDRCPNCKLNIAGKRKAVSICACGFDWREFSVSEIDISELKIALHIYHLCDLPQERVSSDNFGIERPLASLNLEDFIAALFFIAGQYNGISDRFAKRRANCSTNAELHSLLNKSLAVFESWPDRFHEFIEWLRNQHHSAISTTTGLKRDFGRFYRVLYEEPSAEHFAFMRVAFESYLSSIWDGGHIKTYCRRIRKATLDGKKYISAVEASNRLNIDGEVVVKLIETGHLQAKVRDGKRRVLLIDKASVEQYGLNSQEVVSLQEAGRLLGIGHRRVLEITDRGHIKALRGPKVDGHYAWRFSRTTIDNLIKEIERNIDKTKASIPDDILNFHSTRNKLGRLGINFGDFINSIFNNEITPCGKTLDHGLGQFLFSKEEAVRYLKKESQRRKSDYLDVAEAAKILKLNTGYTYFLISREFLAARKPGKDTRFGRLITNEDIENFISTYVTSGKLTGQLKTSALLLIDGLIAHGINPVSGPGIDGGIQWLFKKVDLKSVNLVAMIYESKVQRMQNNKRGDFRTLSQVAKLFHKDIEKIEDLIKRGALTPDWPPLEMRQDTALYLFSRRTIEGFRNKIEIDLPPRTETRAVIRT